MADISQYLQDILDAVYGEDVRNSIHDAFEIINDVSEVILTTGTAVTSASSSSTGFYTDSLYLNTNTYELWKCIGTDSWQSLGILKGDAGSPGQDGDDGNKWYRSSNISGKSPNPTVYSSSGITEANAGDLNLNVSEGAVYHCVTGGDASTATWSYDFTMTGGGGSGDTVSWNQIQTSTGSTKIAEISINGFSTDVYAPSGGGGGLSNAFDEVVVGATTIAASGGDTLTLSAGSNITLTPNSGTKTVEISASGGGDTVSIAGHGTASATVTHEQQITINSTAHDIDGTKYMEQTANSASFTFTNAAIAANSVIDVYTDTWGDNPTSVTASSGSCSATFGAAQSRTVRIYIR